MPPVLPLIKKPARLCLAAGTLFALFLTPLAQGRTWTNLQGKKLEAEFIRLDGQKAVLKRSGGQTVSIPLSQLSREDRDFIAEQEKGGALPSNTADNYHLPWPRSVKCPDNFKVETIKEEPGEYIYETPHFRFICDAKLGTGMIKRLGLLFEATHLANKTLPIGNSPAHDDSAKFPAYLYEKFSTYLENGGREGTAGIFLGTTRPGDRGRILVPFDSLGVKTMGSTYVIDRDKDASTLIHELTHQLMSSQAKQASWFCEGSAEYMGMTPYAGGRFNFGANRSHIVSRVTEYGKKNTGGRALGDDFEAPGLEAYMNMPYSQFTGENANLNYGLAALMAYYFYHMDGKGDARRIKNYMKAIQSGTSEKEAQKLLLDGRSYEELAKEIEQKWRKAGVKIRFRSSS